MFENALKHRSGRVIALARLVLAAVFLLAIWIAPAQPGQPAPFTYGILGGYLAFAVAAGWLTWNDWWREARLAIPSHIVDILMFALLVLVFDGYTSPFFVFFVFLLISAAIRWGWFGTAVTAAAVIFLYLGAGLVASGGGELEVQRFIIRSGNLLTLSALLIWFGVNHGFGTFRAAKDDLIPARPMADQPLETALQRALQLAGAQTAVLAWSETGSRQGVVVSVRATEPSALTVAQPLPATRPEQPHLFDLARDHALGRTRHGRMRYSRPGLVFDVGLARHFGIAEGMAIPVRTDAGQGLLLLGGIKSLCTDHLHFAAILANAVANHVQKHALLTAVEESATARARLAFARDLHDSIVQFLAGATFRVEAIRRSLGTGEADQELTKLKELLLLEQQELRTAIGALRRDWIALPALAGDLKVLCERLSRQWDIECTFVADVSEDSVPMRIHLDTHQLVREAVANAVRHAGARRVTVELATVDSDLRLDITNDGNVGMRLKDETPWSLSERVDEANGTLLLTSLGTGTCVSITLPLDREART